jgi:intein/homing endonuclease
MARFIAHIQGDGCFSPERNAFRYFNKDLDLINDFERAAFFAFAIYCNKPYLGKTCYHVGFRNKVLAELLKKYCFSSKTWVSPEFVFKGGLEIKSAYLQAFFDDESTVTFTKRKEWYNRSIAIQLNNEKGVIQLQELLESFSIESKKYGPIRKKYFELKIMGKTNLIKFYVEIGFVSKCKQLKLLNSIRTYQN